MIVGQDNSPAIRSFSYHRRDQHVGSVQILILNLVISSIVIVQKQWTLQRQAERLAGTEVLHAGTRFEAGEAAPRVVTSGGRVLAVSALGADLREAVRRAYDGVALISFEGMHHRRDIGRDAVSRLVARGQLVADRGRA